MPVISTSTFASVTLIANESLTVTSNGSIFGSTLSIFSSTLGSNVAIAGAVDISFIQLGGSNMFTVTQSGVLHVSSYINLGLSGTVLTGDNILANAGMIFSDGSAVRLFGNNNLVANTGSIIAADSAVSLSWGANSQLVNDGLLSSSFGDTVKFSSAGGSVDNRGNITSQGGDAVQGAAPEMQLNNSGTITSNSATLYNSAVSWASLAGGVTNSGEINGATDYGLSYLLSGTILNTGLITGQVAAVYLNNFAGYLSNSGEISCQSGDAILVYNPSEGGAVTIFNSGTLTAAGNAYVGAEGKDMFTNTGTVIGNIGLGGGNDYFENRGGEIFGQILGGSGDDTYRTDTDLDIVEISGAGNDTVLARTSLDLAANLETLTLLGSGDLNGTGNSGKNTLNGNAGDNRLSGLGENDTIFGNAGDDRLLGGLAADSLSGGDGDDLLRGADGNDTLIGLDGNDTLTGGSGTDLMSGGTGTDVFLLTAWRHSSKALASSDRITDFTVGEDRIDLSEIDANSINATSDAFVFVGTSALSGAGQVNVVIDVVANLTYVQMDIDGDGLADSILRLTGQLALTAGDFIL